MKASDYIVNFFADYEITHIFGYQGGMVTHLVDSISKNQKVQFIQTYHEQSASIAAQGMLIKKTQDFYTSGGLAPMGFALPFAIGAAFANPNRKIISINGDGGFHMVFQSLLLISQYHLNVSVIVLNNESLGMITQFQSLYFNSNFAGTKKNGGYIVPDIKNLADGVHLQYEDSLNNEIKSGTIYNLFVGDSTAVVPKLEFDHSLYNMNPYLTNNEIQYLEKHMKLKSQNIFTPPRYTRLSSYLKQERKSNCKDFSSLQSFRRYA